MSSCSVKSKLFLILFGVIASHTYAIAEDIISNNIANPREVMFLTNREFMHSDGSNFYGAERSRTLSYGIASVIGRTTKDELITGIDMLGQYPATPYQVESISGGIRRKDAVIRAHERARYEIQKYLSEKIKKTSTKQVVLFVHGYNNGFDDAIKSTDQICNDLGWDDFTCIAFSWPAGGSSGALFGYNVDRESGEFSVFDLQKVIRTVSETPGLESIYLICHSRGADIVTMAIQALTREAYMSKSSFAEKFKIGNIVLAAPDVDIDIAFTRIGSLRSEPDIPFGARANPRAIFNHQRTHFTIYTSSGDKALSASQELFGSKHRLGLIDENIDEETKSLIASTGDIADFITVNTDGASLFGHDYYLSNRDVRNDLVNLIKYKKKAGEDGRALLEINRPFWHLASGGASSIDGLNLQK